MFITRKRFEAELEKARCEGAEKVWRDLANERQFAELHERIDRLATVINNLDAQINAPICCEVRGERRC